MGNKISVFWRQNRLTYMMVLVQIHTLVKNVFSLSGIKTIHVFSMYWTVSQSTIITSPIGFNIAFTNVGARLQQRCINVIPTLSNVDSTLFQRQALTLYQRCATLKIRLRILFHFQRRINVISTLIQKVKITLIRRWNVGWELIYLQRLDSFLFLSIFSVFLKVLKNYCFRRLA